MEKQKISFIFKRSMEKAMGKALDYGRMTEMSERAFKQYSRSIKNDFNRIVEHAGQLLVDQGHIDTGELKEIGILKNNEDKER